MTVVDYPRYDFSSGLLFKIFRYASEIDLIKGISIIL